MLTVLRIICFFLCFRGAMGSAEREAPILLAVNGHGSNIVNYAEIRARVARGFIEKANEMADALAVFQDLSKTTLGLREQIADHCSK